MQFFLPAVVAARDMLHLVERRISNVTNGCRVNSFHPRYQNGELKAQGDELTIASKEEPPKAQSDEPSLAQKKEPAARPRSSAGGPSDEGGGPSKTEREPSR